MSDTDELDGAELVAEHWPYDGPHTTETITEALTALSALVRYSSNATFPPERLGLAPEMYQALAGLSGAARGLPQLVEHAALRARELAADPTLRHDEHRGHDASVQMAADTARGADESLSEAYRLAKQLAQAISAAHEQLSHLYHELPDDGRQE